MMMYDQLLNAPSNEFRLLQFLEGDDEDDSGLLLPAQDILLADHMNIASEEVGMDSWRHTDPSRWTSIEVLDWIYSIASIRKVDLGSLRGEYFQNLTGSDLQCMQREEFISRDSTYGEMLFQCFHDLLKNENKNKTHQPLPSIWNFIPQSPSPVFREDQCETLWPIEDNPICFNKLSQSWSSTGSSSGGQQSNTSDSESGDSDFIDTSDWRMQPINNNNNNNNNHERLLPSFPSDVPILPIVRQTVRPSTLDRLEESIPVDDTIMLDSSGYSSTISDVACHPAQPVKKRGPGRPPKVRQSESSSSDVENNNNNECRQANRSPKRRPKGNKSTHLWEFMRTLLEDPAYSPACIKWENQEQGVFRIVPGKSKVIATLWGARKNNETMTFDKLSRSLRWCRTYGFLSEVPKNGGYPKKLCFRFGDRALEWNRAK